MADAGKLYYGFDAAFAAKMGTLCAKADIVLPNITEACFITGRPFIAAGYDEAYILSLCRDLCDMGAGAVVLTGVSYDPAKLGVAVYKAGHISYYFHEKLAKNSHGTGDIFASAFTGAYMRGKTMEEAARIAADFTLAGMKVTQQDETHWYGTKFEKVLPQLIAALEA